MRVLLTTDTVGGVWTYTKELTEGLLERSHAVALVSFGRFPSTDQKSWCSSVSEQYSDCFHYVAADTPLEWMENNAVSYDHAESILLELARDFRADLLHSNQFCFGRLPVPIPKLIVAHSDVLSWAAACRPEGLGHSPWLDRYTDLVQTGLRAADAVAAPTHWMLHAIAQHFTLPNEAHVIANGRHIPENFATPRILQAVTVGRLWDPAKGLATLAEVHAPMPILVAGEATHGNESVPPSLGQASLLGPLADESLLALLRTSSIYLALSLYEPFGLAPLEAALCGCAIVARDIPSFHEVWHDAALYFGDPTTLSALLDELAHSPKLLNQMRQRSRQRAQTMTRSSMTENYLRLYQHLIEPAYPLPSAAPNSEVSKYAS